MFDKSQGELWGTHERSSARSGASCHLTGSPWGHSDCQHVPQVNSDCHHAVLALQKHAECSWPPASASHSVLGRIMRSHLSLQCHFHALLPHITRRMDPVFVHVLSAGRIEKYILRKAFDTPDRPYLPDHVLWRQKEQFSDGVGYNWIDGLKAHADSVVSDQQLQASEHR